MTTAKLQLSSMTIVKHDVGYCVGAYCELGFHMLLICSIFVNVERIIFMYLLTFLYNTKIRDYSNINELPWCVRIASNNMNHLWHYCCFHKCFIEYQLYITISILFFIQYQFSSKNQYFFSVNLHLKTMTFIYLMKYQFLNADHFPLITVDNCNIF